MSHACTVHTNTSTHIKHNNTTVCMTAHDMNMNMITVRRDTEQIESHGHCVYNLEDEKTIKIKYLCSPFL